MDPLDKLRFFEADIDRDIKNCEILKNGGKLKRFDQGFTKSNALNTITKKSRARRVNISSSLKDRGETDNHHVPDLEDINSTSATGQFVDRQHMIDRGFRVINVGTTKNDKRRYMDDNYGLKAAIKHSEESNARDGRACVLTTPGALIMAIGYTDKASPAMKNYNDKRLLMHPIEEAALTADIPDVLIDGKCYTTHLPCYRCLRTLHFLEIKELIYMHDDDNLRNEEYDNICKKLQISIKHIDRAIIQKIIDDDHKSKFVDLDTPRQPEFTRTQVFPYDHPKYTDPNPDPPKRYRKGLS